MVLAYFDREEISLKSLLIAGMLGSCIFGSLCLQKTYTWHKLLLAIAGLGSTAAGVYPALVLESSRSERVARKEVDREIAIRTQVLRVPKRNTTPLQGQIEGNGEDLSGWVEAGDTDSVPLYDWEDLAAENTGIMIAGNAGAGKTSVCCWVLGELTKETPAIIEVLDPHAGINRIWWDLGFTPLSEYTEIESRLLSAVKELDDRRARSKAGDFDWKPYIFVCDELDSCLDNFEDPEVVSKAIKRLGKEGRKYDLSLVFITHTSNVGAKGIDAQERNCYVNICLGGSAHSVAKYAYKNTDPESIFLRQQAYPCLVSAGGLQPIPAIHPTHGQYTKFKKKGNPPQGIRQPNVLSFLGEEQEHCQEKTNTATLDHVHQLESSLAKDYPEATELTGNAIDWNLGADCPYLRGVVRDGVMMGVSLNQMCQKLGISKGSRNKKYLAMRQVYDEFK